MTVRYVDMDTSKIVSYDSFLELTCSETHGLDDPGREVERLWPGDVIRPTNEHSGDGYKAVAQWCSYFGPPLNCPDEEIRSIISEHGLNIADEDKLEQICACLGKKQDGADNLQ